MDIFSGRLAAMKTPHEILHYVGLREAADRLGVTLDRIQRASRSDAPPLPASWYDALENMAGRPLPRECFTFKGDAA